MQRLEIPLLQHCCNVSVPIETILEITASCKRKSSIRAKRRALERKTEYAMVPQHSLHLHHGYGNFFQLILKLKVLCLHLKVKPKDRLLLSVHTSCLKVT